MIESITIAPSISTTQVVNNSNSGSSTGSGSRSDNNSSGSRKGETLGNGEPPVLQKPQLTQQSAAVHDSYKPSFNYDLELFNLCKQYLNTKNHHGLALVARQKGVPPFLRFKIWPILLKYHPFVLDPFIQPDNDIINEGSDSDTSSVSSSKASSVTAKENGLAKNSETASETEINIKKDISRYVQRIYGSSSAHELTGVEKEIIAVIESAVLKFSLKWSKIIKYDSSLSWMALNLAEWFPPIPQTPWVLVGRDQNSKKTTLTYSILEDYSHYIDNVPGLDVYLEDLIHNKSSTMNFHEVYERLVLVLLHCPEPEAKNKKAPSRSNGPESSSSSSPSSSSSSSFSSSSKEVKKQFQSNKTTLPVTGGTIEERVSFFIFCLRKLLPELSQYFHEEQILSKFGYSDDEWLIWWLKFCGTKVWSKYDRGRIWDFMMGWRLRNPKRSFSYYYRKLNYVSRSTLEKLGPDIFWTVGADQNDKPSMDYRRNSFKDLVNGLDDNLHISKGNLCRSSNGSDSTGPTLSIPFSKIDPHVALIFISISLLKSKENTLVELDQHEIRQFLSRLPSKSYEYNSKPRRRISPDVTPISSSTSPVSSSPTTEELPTNSIIISNDSQSNKHKINFIDNIISEAGEQWHLNASVPLSKKQKRLVKKGKLEVKEPKPKPERETVEKSKYGVWIGNLSFDTSKEDLIRFVTAKSSVKEEEITRVNIPKKGSQIKGFAYVDVQNEDQVNKLIELSESNLNGRNLLIKSATSFEGRPEKTGDTGNPPSRILFVGNLSFDVTEDNLNEHFRHCGDISKIRMATFQDTGKCKGFAFIDFKNEEGAIAAMNSKLTKMMLNRKLRLEYGEDRSKRRPKSHMREPLEVSETVEEEVPIRDKELAEVRKPYVKHVHRERTNEKRPKSSVALASAQRASAAIVPSCGKKITFD
ncbi:OCA5 [Candida oxycetoniae]|uniref:Oxidant-induced cell-cycle arrest protein 5 n=1 Tax=Candida oxycetoniae TaxID=497107 RepID=A0AAI9WZ06_9ASCO|nr:OCA5 [Candida oxycetoniae]KAI3405693.2 OCA5 [Candida oxycetoniae]